MAVIHDVTTTILSASVAASPTAVNHNAGAGCGGAIVAITIGGVATDVVTGVTYGGIAMTRIQTNNATSAEAGITYIYFLGEGKVPQAAGNQSVAISYTGTTIKSATCSTVKSTLGYSMTVAQRGGYTNTGTSAETRLALGTGGMSDSAMAFEAMFSGTAGPVSSTAPMFGGMTSMLDSDFGILCGGTFRQTTAKDGSFTMGHTQAADDYCSSGVSVVEVGTDWAFNFPYPEFDPIHEFPVFFQNTAETGLADNTTVTTANSDDGTAGTAWSTVTIAAGTFTYDTGAVHRGTLSYESAHVAVNGENNFAWTNALLGYNPEQYYRAYFRWASAPSVTAYFLNWYNATTFLCGMTVTTGGLIRSVDQIGGIMNTSSAIYTDGNWYRIEVHLVQSTQTFEWRIFSGHSTTALETFSATAQDLGADTFGSFRLGSSHQAGIFTHTLNIDDVAITTEDWLGPSAAAAAPASQFILVNTALGAA